MEIKEIQVSVGDLVPGMYVCRLDCPWSSTPFPIQGFRITSLADVAALGTYCSHVYVDSVKESNSIDTRGAVWAPGARQSKFSPRVVKNDRRKVSSKTYADASYISLKKHTKGYPVTMSLRDEVVRAKYVMRDLRADLSLVSRQISRGKLTDYGSLRKNVEAMVQSVLRCPDAFAWLIRLREKDQHSHDHSLRSSLWAVQFARYVGMDSQEIAVLCLGTLLKDIGKVKVSNVILRKQNRTEEEEREYYSYVSHGVEMLRQTRKVEPRVISIVRYHAERHKGQGFLEGLSGAKIPLLARIAGMATAYDLICNPRGADQPVAPSRAVSLLYNMRGNEFEEDLIIDFIQSVGLYPTGTLVELTTGDIGVVVEQHPKSRLAPQVAILHQGEGDLNQNMFLVDLKEEEKTISTLEQRRGSDLQVIGRVAIARDLEPTGYDVDLSNVSMLFMSGETEGSNKLWAVMRKKMGLKN